MEERDQSEFSDAERRMSETEINVPLDDAAVNVSDSPTFVPNGVVRPEGIEPIYEVVRIDDKDDNDKEKGKDISATDK